MKNADIFHLLGFSSVEQLKDIVVYPLRQKQDPAPRLHYCFLAAPLSYLHPLSSLISNCSNLPFGTQGRSWSLGSIPKKWGTERFLCPGAPQGPAQFQCQSGIFWCCYRKQVYVPGAQWGQTNWNIGVWRKERFISGPGKYVWLVFKRPKLPDVFREEFL